MENIQKVKKYREKKIKEIFKRFSNIQEITIKFNPLIPTIEEMSIITEKFLDDFFPKGKCKERGQALMLRTKELIAIHNFLTEKTKI